MDLLSGTSLPNLHPALVHFPVALLFVGALAEAGALAVRRAAWLDRAAAAAWSLGAASAVAAYLSGRRAADGLPLPAPEVQAAIGRHADAAFWTATAAVLLAVVRLALLYAGARKGGDTHPAGRAVVLAASLPLLALVAVTADRGGALVFRHGVAVARENAPEPSAPAPRSGVTIDEDGAVAWEPGPGSESDLGSAIAIVTGGPGASVRPAGVGEAQGLALDVHGRIFLLLPGRFGDVQVDAEVERARFTGRVGLVHHFRGPGDFGAFVLGPGGTARLVDERDGTVEELDEATVGEPGTTVSLAVAAHGSHLKGYVGGDLAAHGHTSAPPPGRTGLWLDGEGRVTIREVRAFPAD
ncbi:MAG: hypothetical protein D6718_04130 [Acidobacteria bacterium]|nr:MAG: hypothetical protein D6718_04130 [Acidobacteriota bacterium]